MSFASNLALENYLTLVNDLYIGSTSRIIAGSTLIKVNEVPVQTPDEVREVLRSFNGNAIFTFMNNNNILDIPIKVVPKKSLLSTPFLLMDGALIAKDLYPERWKADGYFQIHSIARASHADQSDLKRYELIVSVDGETPRSLGHLKALLDGNSRKKIILRHWSERDDSLWEFKEVIYLPKELILFSENELAVDPSNRFDKSKPIVESLAS